MERIAIPYRATGRFAPVVIDYLDAAPGLREFYRWSADEDGLYAAMQARRFPEAARQVLCDAVQRQYAAMEMQPRVRESLELLGKPSTLTVTTGHQLCLFGGPLYLPFKILNVVRLATRLSAPGRAVVPVFWMASEDHDRPEIDHAYINGNRVEWPGAAAGAVGRLALHGIGDVLAQVDVLLGPGTHADELRRVLHHCYRPEHDLATATRLFIDHFFGRFGVLVLDGDDPVLKRLFIPHMREELVNQVALRSVRYADEKMEERWPAQAHPREINLFHLRPGHRARIEPRDLRFQVLDGGPLFTLDDMLAELEQHPERFSPNVLLRPLYQETILPNVAYVGGGGELAYWLQLKWLFQGLSTPMPVLLLRTSAAFLAEKDRLRLKELGLPVDALFRPLEELRAAQAREHASFPVSVASEKEEATRFYATLHARALAADPTLGPAAQAMAARALKDLDAMGRKLMRAAKRQQERPLQQLEQVHQHFFPGGGLQERRENFMPWYAREGPAFLDRLLAQLDPLDPRFSILPE